jgi:hypothetical protein
VPDARELVTGAAVGRVAAMAPAALGEPGAMLSEWAAGPPRGAFGGSGAASSVSVLTGTARVGAAERPWSAVLKVVAPTAGQDDPADALYWRREALLYGPGLLDDLAPAGRLRALRCYSRDEQADGSVWLWLEHVQENGKRAWPIDATNRSTKVDRSRRVRVAGRGVAARTLPLPLPDDAPHWDRTRPPARSRTSAARTIEHQAFVVAPPGPNGEVSAQLQRRVP